MESDFYSKGKEFWSKVPATIDGMLGGYSFVSLTDIQASTRFLNDFFNDKNNPVGKSRALDCGAGIGRVTKLLLLPLFETVDMVEQNQAFLDQADKYVGEESAPRLGQLYCSGLQNFEPKPNHYDVIWCQWVTGYLMDKDLIDFLKRCKKALRPNGIIVIKDNLTSSGEVDTDHDDSSVTRPKSVLLEIFEAAGLKLLKQRKQYKFPAGLYEVKMFALR